MPSGIRIIVGHQFHYQHYQILLSQNSHAANPFHFDIKECAEISKKKEEKKDKP